MRVEDRRSPVGIVPLYTYPQTGKITVRHKNKGQNRMVFVQRLTPLGVDDGAGANWCFVNGTVGVNSQSKNNRGKIIISIQNKGTNARAPYIIAYAMHDNYCCNDRFINL